MVSSVHGVVVSLIGHSLICLLQAHLAELVGVVVHGHPPLLELVSGSPQVSEHSVQYLVDLVEGAWVMATAAREMRHHQNIILQDWNMSLDQTLASSQMEEGIAAEEGRLEELVEETGDEELIESPSTRASTPLSFSRRLDIEIGNETVDETDASMDS